MGSRKYLPFIIQNIHVTANCQWEMWEAMAELEYHHRKLELNRFHAEFISGYFFGTVVEVDGTGPSLSKMSCGHYILDVMTVDAQAMQGNRASTAMALTQLFN